MSDPKNEIQEDLQEMIEVFQNTMANAIDLVKTTNKKVIDKLNKLTERVSDIETRLILVEKLNPDFTVRSTTEDWSAEFVK